MATRQKGARPNPNIDENEDENVNRLAEEVFQSEGAEEDNEDVVVNLDDDPPDDDGATPPGQTGTRDDKRKSAWGRLRQSEEAAVARAQQLERDLAAERARADAFAQQRQAPPPPAAPAVDPTIEEERRINEEMAAEQNNFRKLVIAGGKEGISAEDQDRFHKKWGELDSRRVGIIANRQVRQALAEENQRRQSQQMTPEGQAATNHVFTQYPEISNNELAGQALLMRVQQKALLESHRLGRPVKPTIPMLDAACKEIKREFNLGAPPPPDNRTKAKFSGMGGGQQPATNGRSNGAGRTITLNKDQRRMALARFKGKEPAEAYKLFAREMAEDDSN